MAETMKDIGGSARKTIYTGVGRDSVVNACYGEEHYKWQPEHCNKK